MKKFVILLLTACIYLFCSTTLEAQTKITVYVGDNCSPCTTEQDVLTKANATFTEKNIDQDAAAKKEALNMVKMFGMTSIDPSYLPLISVESGGGSSFAMGTGSATQALQTAQQMGGGQQQAQQGGGQQQAQQGGGQQQAQQGGGQQQAQQGGLQVANANSKPAVKIPTGKFKFKFNYDPQYASTFGAKNKAEIEEAGRFLAGFIDMDHTMEVTITMDPNTSAHALGAPSEWLSNGPTQSIASKGGIAYSSSSAKGDGGILALTIHELLHTLGFTHGNCQAFGKHVNGYEFNGPYTMKMYGGKAAPLASDQSHFPTGTSDAMKVQPRMCNGGGDLISAMDLAVLADLGYNIPTIKSASGPKFLDVKLNELFGMKMQTGPNSFQNLIVGMGGNDVIRAGKGSSIIVGLGGKDVLISGEGPTEMWGGNHQSNNMGTDEGDIFYIKSAPSSDFHQVKDLEASDKVYLSPALGITPTELEAAMKDPAKFKDMPAPGGGGYTIPGVWLLDTGSFKLGIGSKDGQKPTSAANFEVKDWNP